MSIESDACEYERMATELERATAMAERYGEAVIRISGVLGEDAVPLPARIMKAQTIIAGLDTET